MRGIYQQLMPTAAGVFTHLPFIFSLLIGSARTGGRLVLISILHPFSDAGHIGYVQSTMRNFQRSDGGSWAFYILSFMTFICIIFSTSVGVSCVRWLKIAGRTAENGVESSTYQTFWCYFRDILSMAACLISYSRSFGDQIPRSIAPIYFTGQNWY